MTRVPLVCKHCGGTNVDEVGEVEITFDTWRRVTVYTDGISTVEEAERWETDDYVDHCWEWEDDVRKAQYVCIDCGESAANLGDLLEVAYGRDGLGRVLDETGEPHGPPEVHPEQDALEIV